MGRACVFVRVWAVYMYAFGCGVRTGMYYVWCVVYTCTCMCIWTRCIFLRVWHMCVCVCVCLPCLQGLGTPQSGACLGSGVPQTWGVRLCPWPACLQVAALNTPFTHPHPLSMKGWTAPTCRIPVNTEDTVGPGAQSPPPELHIPDIHKCLPLPRSSVCIKE